MKKTYTILLDTIDRVKNFANIIGRFDAEIDLADERHVVDAKSIMGVFSLNLKIPLKLTICSCSDDEKESLEKALQSFIIEE